MLNFRTKVASQGKKAFAPTLARHFSNARRCPQVAYWARDNDRAGHYGHPARRRRISGMKSFSPTPAMRSFTGGTFRKVYRVPSLLNFMHQFYFVSFPCKSATYIQILIVIYRLNVAAEYTPRMKIAIELNASVY